jgi:cytosine/adenosine deaminase-related metal-dependent hydrolase
MPPAWHVAWVDEVAAMLKSDPVLAHYVTPQYGPAGVQWCSQPLLEAVAEGSRAHGRPVHMHLLETRYQREWADHNYPQGMVKYLDELGLLSPRLTLAHCTWARSDELSLLAERGVTIAVNTSSNLGLKSGIAPLAEMLRLGCRVAMGLDGSAIDEDDDALREMRLAYALHRGWGFETQVTRAQLWEFAAQNGRRSVCGVGADVPSAGRLVPGAPADLLVLNWEALDNDALFPDIDPLDLLLARGTGASIEDVFIGGRQVVSQGRLTTLDEPALCAELLAQVRSALAARPDHNEWRVMLGDVAQDLGPFYRRTAWAGCC